MGKQTAVPFDQDTRLDLFYHFFKKTIILQQKKIIIQAFRSKCVTVCFPVNILPVSWQGAWKEQAAAGGFDYHLYIH